MVDAVTSQVILDGDRLFIGKYTNISDGTGETGVVKIDVTTLAVNQFGLACNNLTINKIWVMTKTMGVNIYFAATANQIAVTVPPNEMYTMSFQEFGGIKNNAGAGKTGSIAFSTVGAAAAAEYTIIIEAIKGYASA